MSIINSSYYRPLQYLGAKTRSIDSIVAECSKLYTNRTYVLDMFSGSSIVSQALSNSRMNVMANDTMAFCTDIATCMLNVQRGNISNKEIKEFINFVLSFKLPNSIVAPFKEWVKKEKVLLEKKDLLGIQQLYNDLPQVWKDSCDNKQKKYICDHIGESALQNAPLIANYYAGTYFGIKQSIDLDNIRNAIELLYSDNHNFWLKSLLMTGLYNVMSSIVHSAGKHYAQPISLKDTNPDKITNQRLFENRGFDVNYLFNESIKVILNLNHKDTGCNCVSNADVTTDSYLASLKDFRISVVYADPPYTAQQYSRFYHIPEVIHSYTYPSLQVFRGHITNGLYPDNKYKSPFCSKSQAYKSFECIFRVAKEKTASLIISYSESKKTRTGNERMISLSDITEIAKEYLPNYRFRKVDFDFDYRQLNSKGKVVEEKDDKEVLLIFEKK